MKLNLIAVVTVIEITNGTMQGVHAFPDDLEGNVGAEALFRKCLKENTELTDGQIELCVDDGHYDTNGYEIFLTHSDTTPTTL
jgi:hypothetical protein